MSMISSPLRAVALAASALLSTHAMAVVDADVVVGFSNIFSMGEIGDAENMTLNIGVAPGFMINQVRWDVSLTAYDPSWLSDLFVTITNTAGEGIVLNPGEDFGNSGSRMFMGSLTLPSDLVFSAGADGRLNFEFHDGFDELALPDGRWNAGSTITLSPVPEPATYGLMALGLLAVGAAARRRRA